MHAAMRRDDQAERSHHLESESERAPSAREIVDDRSRSGDSKSNGDHGGFAATKIPLADPQRQIDDGNTFDPIGRGDRAGCSIIVPRCRDFIEYDLRHDDPRSAAGAKKIETTCIPKENQRRGVNFPWE